MATVKGSAGEMSMNLRMMTRAYTKIGMTTEEWAEALARLKKDLTTGLIIDEIPILPPDAVVVKELEDEPANPKFGWLQNREAGDFYRKKDDE